MVELEPVKAPMETWRKRADRIVLTEDMKGSKDDEDGDDADPEKEDVEIGVSGDGHWIGGMVEFIVGCQSEADAVDDAVNKVFPRNDLEKLSEGELFEDIF